jgi:hypothetical protein
MASSINALTAAGGGIAMGADASGILQLQSAGTATVTVGTAGGVGIGTTTTTNAKLTVNDNTVLPATAPPAGTNLWVTGANAVTSRITLDSFGSSGNFTFRSANGTAAAPTATLANVTIGTIASIGYGATAYPTTSRASLVFIAAENWTDTAQGSYQVFNTTAIGSAIQTERMRIDNVGNVTLQKNISVGGAAPTTSGSGITFPATQSASSDANTLDDYEEGTFTVTDQSGAGLTFSNNTGRYVKVGGLVYFAMDVIFPTTASVTNIALSLPFQSGTSCAFSAAVGYSNSGSIPSAYIGISQSSVSLYSTTGVAVTNVTFSGKELAISGCYPTT